MRNLHPHTHPWNTTEDRTHTIPQHTWLWDRASRLLNSLRTQGSFMVLFSTLLIAVSLSFSLTAYWRVDAAEYPDAVARAQAAYDAGDPYTALHLLNEYANTLNARLLEVPDALIQDQLAALWENVRNGSYTKGPSETFPPYLRQSSRAVLHPHALMLAAEIISGDRATVLEGHAHAERAGTATLPDWAELDRKARYLPRMLYVVALQVEPSMRLGVRSALTETLDKAMLAEPAQLATALRPYLAGMALAEGDATAQAWLEDFQGREGATAAINFMVGPALFALDALEPETALARAAALHQYAETTYTDDFRAETARLLEMMAL
jgi:hypothetical protein